MAIDVVVIGAGGFGRETIDVIEAHNRASKGEPFNVLGVIDDSPSDLNLERLYRRGYQHLGGIDAYFEMPVSVNYFIGIGNPAAKAQMAEMCNAQGRIASSVAHPSASIGSETTFELGAVICGGVQISTNVQLGRHVHLNPGCIIGHDTRLEDFVSVNPGAIVSGDVHLSGQTLIGAGAVVLQGRHVGEGAIVGASACVTRDISPSMTVVGVPARNVNQSGSGNNLNQKRIIN